MKKLGKKHNENLDTIEAFNCSDIYICNCTGPQYTWEKYYERNNDTWTYVHAHHK